MEQPIIDLDSHDVTLRKHGSEVMLTEADLSGAEIVLRFAVLNQLSMEELREAVEILAHSRRRFNPPPAKDRPWLNF